MSLRHSSRSISTGRSAARFIIALLVAMVGLVGIAGPASAHHPEITGTVKCDGLVHYTATAWSTTNTSARAHNNIEVQRSFDNGSTWIKVTSGRFDSTNGYQFSGTFAAPSSGSVRLRAIAIGNWVNGSTGGQVWTTDPIPVPTDCALPTASISNDCDDLTAFLDNTKSKVTVPFTITVKNNTTGTTTTKQESVLAGKTSSYTAPVTEDQSYTVTVTSNGKTLATSSFTVNCVTTSPTAGAITHTCSTWSVALDNTASNVAVPYTITVNGVTKTVTVPAKTKQTYSESVVEDKAYSIKVAAGGKQLAEASFIVNCASPTASAISNDCAKWTVLLDNTASNVPVVYTVTVNGLAQQVTVPAGGQQTVTGPVVEDSTNTVSVAANGSVLQSATFIVNCVAPPAPTTTPTTPTTDTEVLPEQASGKAVGTLRVSCQGTVRVTMRNRSSERVAYTVKIAKRSHKIAVASGKTRKWVTSAAPRERAQLWLGDKLLASKRLPKACVAPDVLPDTGQRD